MSKQRLAGVIDAACDKSAEDWLARIRKREASAYRTGYADGKVRHYRPNKQPYELRAAYRRGYWRCRDEIMGLAD